MHAFGCLHLSNQMAFVTLLSDFGLQDASVAITKGLLMQHIPDATIVDVSHQVETYNTHQAAYLLLSSYRNFPKGSCHILLFDVFSEPDPRLLLCEFDGHYMLAPDNGVMSLAFGEKLKNVWLCHTLKMPGRFNEWLQKAGETVAKLQRNTPEKLGLKEGNLKVAPHQWLPVQVGNAVECHVIHIDHYQNVVINMTKEQFEAIGQGRPFRIQFARNEEITKLSSHFYEVAPSEKLCRFNSTGFLEICINRGKAASLFGLSLFQEEAFIYNTINIYFA